MRLHMLSEKVEVEKKHFFFFFPLPEISLFSLPLPLCFRLLFFCAVDSQGAYPLWCDLLFFLTLL